jgi:DNA polymerase-4
VPDALRYDEATLIGWLGEGTGRMLYRRVRGLDPTPVAPRAAAKSISREETFPRDLHDDGALEAELLGLVVRASADLRREGLLARTVTVRIRDMDFRTRQAGRTLAEPVESDRAIHAVALELLKKLRTARRTPVRLLGVALSQLTATGAGVQLGLFDGGAGGAKPGNSGPAALPAGPSGAPSAEPAADTARDRSLARAVDALRERYGPDAVLPGRIVKR